MRIRTNEKKPERIVGLLRLINRVPFQNKIMPRRDYGKGYGCLRKEIIEEKIIEKRSPGESIVYLQVSRNGMETTMSLRI